MLVMDSSSVHGGSLVEVDKVIVLLGNSVWIAVVVVELSAHVGSTFSVVQGSEVDTPALKKVEWAEAVMEVFQPCCSVQDVVFTASGIFVDEGASEGGAVIVVITSTVVVIVTTSRVHSGSTTTVDVLFGNR